MGERKTVHLDIISDQVGKCVFLPDSMERAALIAERFDSPVRIACRRELLTYTGTLKGVPVAVTSTGIGGPSVCITTEELHSCGAHIMMRAGSTVSTSQEAKIGNVVILNGAVYMEGADNHYLPFEFPAAPDFEILKALETVTLKLGCSYDVGITITEDPYYTEAEPETKPVYEEFKYKWDFHVKGGATSTSMECAILFLIGASLGIRTSGMMISVTNFGEHFNDVADYPDRWEQRAIEMRVEATRQIILQDKEKGVTIQQ